VALCSWECPGINEIFHSRECSGALTIIAHRALVPDSMAKIYKCVGRPMWHRIKMEASRQVAHDYREARIYEE